MARQSGGADGDGGDADVDLLGHLVEPAVQVGSCGCGSTHGNRGVSNVEGLVDMERGGWTRKGLQKTSQM